MNYADNQPTTRITAGSPYPAEQKWIDPAAPVGGWPAPPAPTANGGWAVTTIIFFWPLAFVAFSQALSVPTLIAQGRILEAQAASDSVARLGKIALVCGLTLLVVLFALEAVVLRNLSVPDSSLYRPTQY